MNELAVSRRAVTRALSTLPILALTNSSVEAGAAELLSASPGMAAAVDAYRAAAAASAHHYNHVYNPAWRAWRSEADAIPHVTTTASFNGWASFDHLSTAERGMVEMARAIMKDATPGQYRDYEVASAELLEAEDRRQSESNRLAARHNLSALSAENDRLGEIRDDLLGEVENFPVTSLADLIAKIEVIEETDGQIMPADLMADLRRIAGRA